MKNTKVWRIGTHKITTEWTVEQALSCWAYGSQTYLNVKKLAKLDAKLKTDPIDQQFTSMETDSFNLTVFNYDMISQYSIFTSITCGLQNGEP